MSKNEYFGFWIIDEILNLVREDNPYALNIKGEIAFIKYEGKSHEEIVAAWKRLFSRPIRAAQNGAARFLIDDKEERSRLLNLGLYAFYLGGREWDMFRKFCLQLGRAAA